mmetsp:Transcript_19506/g.19613  ORF Transcript_19506/g.19613 Transcript_19506/m.19613 type:complete len:114 (+) Transcript_19506:83-424(+)
MSGNPATNIIDTFERRLDANFLRLSDSYRSILLESQVADEVPSHKSLLLDSSAANIVHAAQSLLDQIHELRLHIILQDFETISSEVGEERRELQECLSALPIIPVNCVDKLSA